MAINKEELQIFLQVEKGQVSFDAEGNEGGPWHSRKAHIPPGSGVTIGRGYDVMQKTAEQIRKDFNAAGISMELAEVFATFIGLKGSVAKAAMQNVQLPEITLEQQKKLFEITYREKEQLVINICKSSDVVTKYGYTNWEILDPRIKEVLIDLAYRGDYTREFRERTNIQQHIVNNDLEAFKKVVIDLNSYDKKKVLPTFKRLADRAAILNKPIVNSTIAKQLIQAPHETTKILLTPLTPIEQSALEGMKVAAEFMSQQSTILFGFPPLTMPTEEEMQRQAKELMAYSNAALEEANRLAARFQCQQRPWV
jgi:hypothetical protein